MKVCIIGGLDRMEKEYIKACKAEGYKAKVFNKLNSSFDNSLKCTQCVLLLTKLSSHNMAAKAKNLCRKHNIPLLCIDKTSPSSVACAMKDFVNCNGCEHENTCWNNRQN
jgi:hypothetical protein